MRTTTADPIIKTYTEGERAQLTCSIKFNEIIDITSINYFNDTCSHSQTYGIRNLCNGKTVCRFDVSNSNIGSSCGANGTAMFKVEYNCIHQNTACWKTTVNWNCQDGLITVIKAVWETSQTCGTPYTGFISYNVINRVKATCENRRNCSFIAFDYTFSESCSSLYSRCTIFDYVYTCIKATWDDWSSWSKCSRSCGSGSQTRQRQCLNQINDTDGFVSDCDGVGTNLRSCNTEPCPYCDDTKFQYRLQKPLSDLKDDTGSGSGYLITNGIFTVNCCGRIKLWEFMPVKAGSLKFIVVRKTEGGKYRCVGSNVIDISESDLHKTAQIRVSDDERIAVTQGDIIGWFGSGHIIGYYECIPSSKPCPVSLKLNYSVSEGDTIDLGTLSNSFNRIYALNYSTIANRAVTIAIPSKPVTIPDHLMVDSFVMTIPIYDPDYGDFILDFKLDYNNDYFYLDTKLRSVHAKNPLPHVIGQQNTTLNFTCTVQDSCFNLASTTITIISYNVPPVITELPDILRKDLQQLQEETSCHIFHVEDPSNDTVSCALRKISPTTDALIFKMDGNDAYLIVSKHTESNLTLEYDLQICCYDGTDDTVFNLTVHFCTENNCQGISASSQSNKLQIVLVYCFIAGMLTIIIISVLYLWKRQKPLNVENGSHDSSRNSRYISTIQRNSAVHKYDDLDKNGHQQILPDNVEISAQDTTIYENTNPFI